MNALEKLRQVTDQIGASQNGLEIVDAWTLAGRLVSRFPVDQAELKRVLTDKDHAGLDTLVSALENPDDTPKGPVAQVSDGDMHAAMRAFRKRLKLARLDEESKLGGRYTSGGKKSSINAIEPPKEFPREVWKALEASGKLEKAGSGFYREPVVHPGL